MPEEPHQEESPVAPIVLIDNNMIQHFLSKDVGEKLEPLLSEFQKAGAVLAVSQIVVYEALKAIIFNPGKFSEVNAFFEKYLMRFPVDEAILMEAARVHEIYGSDDCVKGFRNTISTEDIIIATTAMLRGAYVVTCDASDFPVPFFKEINREYVDYVFKGRRKHIVVYLLQPDNIAVGKALEQLQTS